MKNLNLNEMQGTQGGDWYCADLGTINSSNYAETESLFNNVLSALPGYVNFPTFGAYLVANCTETVTVPGPGDDGGGAITIMI